MIYVSNSRRRGALARLRPKAARAARLRRFTPRGETANALLVDALPQHLTGALRRLGLGTFWRMTLRSVDLRKDPVEAALDRAERMLGATRSRDTGAQAAVCGRAYGPRYVGAHRAART